MEIFHQTSGGRGLLRIFPCNTRIIPEYSPIIPALCSMLFRAYYSQNYAGIIRPTLPTSSLCVFNSCNHTQPHPKPCLISIPCNWYWCLYSCMKLREPSISCKEVIMTGLKLPGVEELTWKAWRTTPHE